MSQPEPTPVPDERHGWRWLKPWEKQCLGCGEIEWLGASTSTRGSARKMRQLDRKHAHCQLEARDD